MSGNKRIFDAYVHDSQILKQIENFRIKKLDFWKGLKMEIKTKSNEYYIHFLDENKDEFLGTNNNNERFEIYKKSKDIEGNEFFKKLDYYSQTEALNDIFGNKRKIKTRSNEYLLISDDDISIFRKSKDIFHNKYFSLFEEPHQREQALYDIFKNMGEGGAEKSSPELRGRGEQ